jgi:hypothetical protein
MGTKSGAKPVVECRHFNGYKPCGKSEICDPLCPHMSVPSIRILVIHLEALGAVMRSTALLPAVRRKYPGAHITWITQKPAHHLLAENPLIDRVLTTDADDLLKLSVLEFDIALVIDKGQKSAGVLKLTFFLRLTPLVSSGKSAFQTERNLLRIRRRKHNSRMKRWSWVRGYVTNMCYG